MDTDDIYEPEFVAALFDRCSSSYRWWSAVASFGMIWRWREVCVSSLPSETKANGEFVDLMAGTGEVWPHLTRRFPDIGEIRAIDISKRMHEEAVKQLHANRSNRISHVEANVLDIDLVEHSADCVVSTFGLKTFNTEQQARIATQVNRILKPGGTCLLYTSPSPRDS